MHWTPNNYVHGMFVIFNCLQIIAMILDWFLKVAFTKWTLSLHMTKSHIELRPTDWHKLNQFIYVRVFQDVANDNQKNN